MVPGLALRIPEPGESLAGKYRIRRVIGSGGMGVVLEAEHLRLRQAVAIKFLNPAMLDVAEVVERFEREARAAATLKSRHVVRVTDVEATPEGVPYMVMELLEGTDLESERERRPKQAYPEVVDYVLQACAGLAEAHDAGIVHRDLKPGNLFLAREGRDRVVVKVLDFGISKFLRDDAKLTSAGSVLGTALYMSPEQVKNGAVDERTDVWALGVILYELLSGAAPWTGPPTYVAASIVSSVLPDIRKACELPEALAQTIEKMLEKDASRRLGSIAEVVAALAPFAPPHSVGAEVAEQIGRRRISFVLDVSSPRISSRDLETVASAQTIAMEATNPPRRAVETIGPTTKLATAATSRGHVWIAAIAGFALVGICGAVLIYAATRRALPKGDPSAAAMPSASASPVLDPPSPPAPATAVLLVASPSSSTLAAPAGLPSEPHVKPASSPRASSKRVPQSLPAQSAAQPKPAETNPQFLK